MALIEDLINRELVQDYSDLESLKSLKPGDKCYVGFDPTAPSLQVGNLVPLLMLIRLGKAGIVPITLFGGATGAIGDPSGKNSERQLLERSVIEQNISTQTNQAKQIFSREDVTPVFVNNYDWTKDVSTLDFLRDVGKYFTVNYMISKEVVKTRLNGEGISYTEFSYMLLQAFDFLHLYTNQKCRMQIGGSDQWGNITAGLELIRKKLGETDAVAFSIPLLTNSEGKKFGKSESGGAIWLDPNMTSPYQFHQFWLNTPDADVMRYLKVFTLVPDSKLVEIAESLKIAPEKREAQNILADTVTTLVHGEEATSFAKKSASVLFGGSIEGIPESQLLEIFSDVPSSEIKRESLSALSIPDLMVETGAIKSKGEAKRLITGGGVYINSIRITDATSTIDPSLYHDKGVLILRTGKKNYHLIRIS